MSADSVERLIRRLAGERSWQLYALCLKADLSPTLLGKAFQRKTKIRPDNLRRLAAALDRPFLDLLFEQEDVTGEELEAYLLSDRTRRLGATRRD